MAELAYDVAFSPRLSLVSEKFQRYKITPERPCGAKVKYVMDLLTLDKVAFYRGERQIFRDLSMRLPVGAHHVVAGPSGVGKSTLLGLVCGILTPDEGKVVFAGDDMAHVSRARRDMLRATQMGVVFQNLGLASALSVEGNLALAQAMAGQQVDRQHQEVLFQRLGLLDRRHAKPRRLSRGEAQRAGIARALITKPKLLIADEPTASLDAASRDTVMDLLFEQAGAHAMTLIVSTHDPAIIARFAHKVELPLGEAA